MKYKIFKRLKKSEQEGGAYWRNADMAEHFKLTPKQSTFQYLLKTFKPPLTILEAGCGLGRWVVPMAQEGYTVTGIEIENEAVNILKQHYKAENLKVIQGDIFNMPFEDQTFDLVISLGVLEHFEEEAVQQKAIQEHLRVMKGNGLFLVTVPYVSLLRRVIHWPYTRLLSRVRKRKGKEEHFSEYRYSAGEFRKILEQNDLTIIDQLWDDLLPPYSFGLTVDYPVKRLMMSKDKIQYKLNRGGMFFQKFCWAIYPGLISGGIGFVCKRKH